MIEIQILRESYHIGQLCKEIEAATKLPANYITQKVEGSAEEIFIFPAQKDLQAIIAVVNAHQPTAPPEPPETVMRRVIVAWADGKTPDVNDVNLLR